MLFDRYIEIKDKYHNEDEKIRGIEHAFERNEFTSHKVNTKTRRSFEH